MKTRRTKVASWLIPTTAIALVVVGWGTDRYFLNQKIQDIEFSVGEQSLAEYYGPLSVSWYKSETESMDTSVTMQELASCQTWDARKGNPPISAREAIALANAAASKLCIYGENNCELSTITLSQLAGETENGSHWCWRADYNGYEIWVLLNGSVIVPKLAQD